MGVNGAGLADIVGPAAPPLAAAAGHAWLWAAAAATLLLAAALGIGWVRGTRMRRARRRMRDLHAAFCDGDLCARDSAYLMAWELRHALGVERLRADRPPSLPPRADRSAWPEFVRRLDGARYRPAPPPDPEMQRLFAQAQSWLRRYR